MEDITYHMP
jgi:hypothetical protein